jgi:hypothetical protein
MIVLAIYRLTTPANPDAEVTVINTTGGNISCHTIMPGFVTSVAVSNANPTVGQRHDGDCA